MAKDSQRLEQEFIATVHEKTGHELGDWLTLIAGSGIDKPNAILNWLKTEHKLNHLQANFLTGLYLNDGKPVFDYAVLFENLMKGKETLLPTYQALAMMIKANLPDAELIPTKTYISIEAARIFACATLTKQVMRIGLDLGATPFDSYVQKAKSLGAMPNLTHMVEVTAPSEIGDQLLAYLQQAYRRAHKL
ncbi:MAG: DUF4287 domain-containing protein [Chloroflexi bacterium]|nr:DUF4287 domain-containing protein [Chloroflexota bacterium]